MKLYLLKLSESINFVTIESVFLIIAIRPYAKVYLQF